MRLLNLEKRTCQNYEVSLKGAYREKRVSLFLIYNQIGILNLRGLPPGPKFYRGSGLLTLQLSSSSYELFVVSIMQKDVYIGYTALALTLGLQFFSKTGATTTGRLLGHITCLPHKDGDIPLSVLPKDTASKLAGVFSTLSLFF